MLHTSAGAAGEDPEAGMVLGLQEPSQRRGLGLLAAAAAAASRHPMGGL